MDTHENDEVLEGHVMDVACIRKAPIPELPRRAADHSTDCGLMGHCIESGYGLIDDEGHVHLLDPAATAPVVQHLLETSEGAGLRLVVRRRPEDGAMHTVDVVRGGPSYGAVGEHIAP